MSKPEITREQDKMRHAENLSKLPPFQNDPTLFQLALMLGKEVDLNQTARPETQEAQSGINPDSETRKTFFNALYSFLKK